MKSANYDVKCLLCGAELGQILHGRFTRPAGGASLPRRRGMPRCSKCGGSLYLERIDSPSSIVLQARLAKMLADESASLASA